MSDFVTAARPDRSHLGGSTRATRGTPPHALRATRGAGSRAVAVLALGWLLIAATGEAAPAFHRAITVNAGQVTGGPLTDYPFLFNTTDPALRTTANGGSVAKPLGWDIMFATSPTCADWTTCGGAKLDHEIERYNATTGELVAWVRVPVLDNGTVLYIHYGDGAVAASTENRLGVWDANYQAVWHLSEAPADGANGGHVDSKHNTAAGALFNNGTVTNFLAAPSSTSATGIAAGADRFYRQNAADGGGNNNDVITVPDHASLEPTGEMTLEMWVNAVSLPAAGSSNNHVLALKGLSNSSPSYEFYFEGRTPVTLVVEWNNSALANYVASNPGPFSTSTWYHVAAVVTSANVLTLYVNGSNAGTSNDTVSGTIHDTASQLRIGNDDFSDVAANAVIDEVRLSNRGRSAGWLSTEYKNLSSPSTFYSLAGTAYYRSVGVTATSLNTASRTVGIVGTTATFSGSMPANVGVGDVLQYQVGAPYYLAFISGRTSDTVYTVQSSAGGTPQGAVAGTAVGVYRAYNSLSRWQAQDENDTLDNSVENFDTARDLVAASAVMSVACYGDGADTTAVAVLGWNTAAANYIRIYTPTSLAEVGTSQRHPGKWDASRYVLQAPLDVLAISDNYVRVEGLQVYVTANIANNEGIGFSRAGDSGASYYEVSANIVRGTPGNQDARIGINPYNAGSGVIKIWNNIVYDFSGNTNFTAGILLDDANYTHYVYDNTVVDCGNGIYLAHGTVVAKNNLVFNNADNYYLLGGALFDASSTNNLSNLAQSDAPGSSPRHVATVTFASYIGDDFHLAAADTGAQNQAVNLSADANLAFANDIDGRARPVPWDIGADEYDAATAVRLASFWAMGLDAAVSVEWETASELDNLGFHLYRGPSFEGPWERLTADLIPGLGSSPEGKRYAYLDAGLRNGATYYYRLEDLDRSTRATSHGPVSATPFAGAAEPGGTGETPGAGGETSGEVDGGSTEAKPVGWTEHGDARDVSLRLVGSTRSSVTLELRTGGFYSLAQEDGSQRFFVPGFFDLAEPGFPALPTRRAWTNAVVGLGARVASVTAEELLSFDGLLPATAGSPQAASMRDGTYQAVFRPASAAPLSRGLYPRAQARVLQTAFQGDVKKAYLELAPLRLDASRGRLVLSRRMIVTVVFDGDVSGETGIGGSVGRRPVLARRTPQERLLARFVSRSKGLHAVSWEDLLAATTSGAPDVASSSLMLATASMRLSRLGDAVPFHVEPRSERFGPGSTLFFLADNSSAYTQNAVYELAVAPGGLRMALGASSRGRSTAPATPLAPLASLLATTTVEQNVEYLPSLLDAPDLWLWSGFLAGPAGIDTPFSLATPASGTAKIRVRLQGGSDTSAPVDHRVRVSINGTPLIQEARWDGLTSFTLEAEVPDGVLHAGSNTLHLEGFGEPGSAVYLDRFSLDYPRGLAAVGGSLEGQALQDGLVEAAGFDPGSVLLDLSGRSPRWIDRSRSSLAFAAEQDHHYLAVSPRAFLRPTIRPIEVSPLRDPSRQADWILVAPRELLPAAEPLLRLRQDQGLSAIAVSVEDVYDSFGFGEPSPQALREFLAFAYHHWTQAAPRYVLLLGDATYDPKGFLAGTSRRDLIPSPITRSSFLWAPSDPLLACVNGDDTLPDLALGRIPASSLAEARDAVQKILDFERTGRTLDGKAVLVADNPDLAGDFEADAEDIASLLHARSVEKVFLTQLGTPATKAAVRDAFDSGASLVSYVGHGSASLWASEGLLRSQDVPSLLPQPAQPLVLAMTCSNGYFVSPFGNSLVERLALAPDKGAIATFSPTGLSLDGPAHLYHRALVSNLESPQHRRIGDVVLAAQQDYTQTGAFPEFLTLYHLLGDPALVVR